MKRLLLYLSIVFSLGILFNVNVNSENSDWRKEFELIQTKDVNKKIEPNQKKKINVNETEDIIRLKKLLNEGVITKEEFSLAKSILSKQNDLNKETLDKKKQNTLQQDVKKVDANENLKQEIENQIEKEKNITCIKYTKKDPFLFAKLKKEYSSFKNKKFTQLNYCIKKSGILKLKIPNNFKPPQELLNELKGCKSNLCFEKLAGQKVYKIFVQRGEKWNARHPGDVIIGMAWFEIMYNGNLRKIKKTLARYEKDNYEGLIMQLKKKDDEKKIHSLISMNNGRLKMREALGFTIYDNTRDVIDGQLLLGNFLNKDELKITVNEVNPQFIKKKMLIDRYKRTLAKYKAKLEEKKNK
tara:strand:+ start:170 stop:1234 length:1065 start_codon:yes stop_codon:yes gene_type:complete